MLNYLRILLLYLGILHAEFIFSKDTADFTPPPPPTENQILQSDLLVEDAKRRLSNVQMSRDSAFYEYQKATYIYFQKSLKHREDTYRWQYDSALWIFWTVITVVFLGLLFSAIHFYISLITARSNIKSKKSGKEQPTEVEISSKGVKISSSILGVIILSLSLVFFYLYLAFVYPISENSIDRKPVETLQKK